MAINQDTNAQACASVPGSADNSYLNTFEWVQGIGASPAKRAIHELFHQEGTEAGRAELAETTDDLRGHQSFWDLLASYEHEVKAHRNDQTQFEDLAIVLCARMVCARYLAAATEAEVR